MKNHVIYNWLFTLFFLAVASYTTAQFDGGEGDGAYKSSTIQITLNGAPINTLGMYRGGIGEGQDKQSNIVTLSGDELSVLFRGGKSDGNDKDIFLGTLAGDFLANLYEGGEGDGQNKSLVITTLDGVLLESLYKGGSGDGQDKDPFAGMLDGTEIAQLYGGGNGDGQDKHIFIGVLDGQVLEGLYSGGDGDGNDKNIFIGVLDGQTLSGLYSGGSGDGFSKHMIQYIFDFPGCTFVVNTDDDGFGSLRYAINCAAPGDTIEFSPLLIQDSIVLTSTNLEVTKDLYINGNKTAELTIDGSQIDRAFKLGTNILTIKGLRIIVGSNLSGGAVLSNGMMTLMDVEIYDPNGTASTVIQTSATGSLTIQGDVKIMEN